MAAMQLHPFRLRLTASLVASTLLLLVTSPTCAQLFDVGTTPLLGLEGRELDDSAHGRSEFEPSYQPEFAAFDRSLIGRAPPGITGLLNNIREHRTARPGEQQNFVFEAYRIFDSEEDGDGGGSVEGQNTEEPSPTQSVEVRDTNDNDENLSEEAKAIKRDEEGADAVIIPRQRQPKTIYISATTCEQPQRRGNQTSMMEPPQISLFVSTSEENQKPGPDGPRSQQEFKPFEEGAVQFAINTTGDVFFTVSLPMLNEEMFEGQWSFDVAVSTDSYFHAFESTAGGLLVVDSDSNSAFLSTRNLTEHYDTRAIQQIMDNGLQYVMFLDSETNPSTSGVRHSMCGLSKYAPFSARVGGQFGSQPTTFLTTRGPGGLPKQQFHFTDLRANSSYLAILAYTGSNLEKRQLSNRAGGGGQVFSATQLDTKEGDNCEFITNLDFCDETEYAVPANNELFSKSELAEFYDDMARDSYANFSKQLAQVACEAPSSQRYSLVANCTDCEVAYKNWLCSVLIPRCDDFSSDSPWALARNVNQPFPNGTELEESVRNQFSASVNQKSRVARIDEEIKPGPYREILPCEDLCYDLVRKCPASLGFYCPRRKQNVFNSSYQIRGEGLTCNFPGSVQNPSGTTTVLISGGLLWTAALVAAGMLVVPL